jgi:hypothetical protein
MPNNDTPSPPDTPRDGIHSTVDVGSLAERAIDKAHDAKKIAMHADDRSAEALQLSKKHAEMIELLPAMNTKLELALRPRAIHPIVQGTVAVAAIFWTLFLGSIAYTLVHPTPARASVPVVETARR